MIFEFLNYRDFLNSWVEQQGGHGLKRKLAEGLNVSSGYVSQVFKGDKNFTPEQASDLCDFLALSELESDYLQLLIEKERAGHSRYRQKIEKKIQNIRQQANKIKNRVTTHRELTDAEKGIYYSSWLYTAVRNLVAIEGKNDRAALAQHLKIDLQTLNRILKFLIELKLVTEGKSGALEYGSANILVDKDSPFVGKHHQNWRLQALQQMEKKLDEDLFFTSPMSLSAEDFTKIRQMIPDFIQKVAKVVGPSKSERVACLNIDWFGY